MEWTRTETLAMAAEKCTLCRGDGQRSRKGRTDACPCVYRAIFRACYNRFVACARQEKYVSRVTFQQAAGPQNRGIWSRKDEEYTADFLIVTKRALSAEDYRIFSAHYLLGADWKLCVRQLKMDKGLFFHAIYRIQQKLGRIYRELQPYALFPLDEYFHGMANDAPAPNVVPIDSRKKKLSDLVPLKKVA